MHYSHCKSSTPSVLSSQFLLKITNLLMHRFSQSICLYPSTEMVLKYLLSLLQLDKRTDTSKLEAFTVFCAVGWCTEYNLLIWQIPFSLTSVNHHFPEHQFLPYRLTLTYSIPFPVCCNKDISRNYFLLFSYKCSPSWPFPDLLVLLHSENSMTCYLNVKVNLIQHFSLWRSQ